MHRDEPVVVTEVLGLRGADFDLQAQVRAQLLDLFFLPGETRCSAAKRPPSGIILEQWSAKKKRFGGNTKKLTPYFATTTKMLPYILFISYITYTVLQIESRFETKFGALAPFFPTT